jgi:hypothetical protein
MRLAAAFLALAATTAIASAAVAAPGPSGKTATLAAGDWHRAAELGATAADVVRALQAKGAFADMVPEESVVTIGPDNRVDVVALAPLPALPAETAEAPGRTAGLSGSGFAFGAQRGSIILYPAYAQSFAPEGGDRQTR